MKTYIAKMQIGEGDQMPIGATLYGVCDTSPSTPTKRVDLSMFDSLVHGVTIVVKFTQGNENASNVKLKVANTLAYDVRGDCRCGVNETISFTFEETQTAKYWYAHVGGLSESIKNYVEDTINSSTETPNVFIMKGSVGIGGNPGSLPINGYETGWTYRIITDGVYASQSGGVGDLIIAIRDADAGQQSVNPAHWIIIQSKINNAVIGPNYAEDEHIVVFDGTSGKIIKDSGITLPVNPQFTDTTYSAGNGLLLNNTTHEFSVDFGNTANTVTQGNDPRLSDARTPTSHTHGNISNNGTIGTSTTNALLRVTNGEIDIGPIFGTNANKFLNELGNWVTPSYPVLSVNNKTGDVVLTAADLGIGSAIKFIGAVASDSVFQPSDGASGTPTISNWSGSSPYAPAAGDIILDKIYEREYIYTLSNIWELLGSDNCKRMQTAITKPDVVANRWVSAIGQNENGEIIVEYSSIDTTSDWPGNAVTANALATPREIYVDLESTRNLLSPILFDGSTNNIGIQVDGVLPIAHGGTGVSSFEQNQVLLTNSANQSVTAFETRAYTNNTNATALTISDNFVTEKTIYYGLPLINGLHNYDASTTLFIPTDYGAQYQILVSNGNREPIWTVEATLESKTSNVANFSALTTLTLGNDVSIASSIDHSEGNIILFSSGTKYHMINGVSTSTYDYTHSFLNASGYIVQIINPAQVGDLTQPVYVDSDGIVQPITYIANRLYYSSSTDSFSASNHYVSSTQLLINIIPNANETFNEKLYVNGLTTIAGETQITDGGDASGVSSAAFTVVGGVGIGKKLYVGGAAYLNNTLNITGDTVIVSTTDATGNNDGALTIGGGVDIGKQLYVGGLLDVAGSLVVHTSTSLLGAMGIGGAADSSTQDPHILTVHGSILLTDGTYNAAHLDIVTNSNAPYINFIPETSTSGYIGTALAKWHSGYFYDSLNLITSTSSIELQTRSSNNDCGILTITAVIPTINLVTTTQTSGTTEEAWVLTNTAGTLLLSNEVNTELSGSDYGFILSGRLYINNTGSLSQNDTLDLYVNGQTELHNKVGIGDAPDSTVNGYILKITGSTLITDAAQLDVTTSNNVTWLDFIPVTDTTGYIGSASNRWNNAYLYDSLNLITQTSSILIQTRDSDNDCGIITITAASPTIDLISTATNHIDWRISNNGSIFKLENLTNTNNTISIEGNNNGFKFSGNVGINTSPETIAANSHSLAINGSTIIIDGEYTCSYLETYTETINSNITHSTCFYPSTNDSGYIGLETNRWSKGYFSDLLEIGSRTSNVFTGISLEGTGMETLVNGISSIILDTTIHNSLNTSQINLISGSSTIDLITASNNNNINTGQIAITADAPSILLTTLVAGASAWLMKNDATGFNLNNQLTGDSLIEFKGNDSGFELYGRVGIGTTLDDTISGDWHRLTVLGSILLQNQNQNTIEDAMHIDIVLENNTSTATIYPNINNTGSLGIGMGNGTLPHRWGKVFIGTDNTYGDPYLPIYWNNGVPQYLNGTVQQKTFTFTNGDLSIDLESPAYDQLNGIGTYVLQIVVTSGAQHLLEPISWSVDSNNNNIITLSTNTAVTGTVTGYILTARGCLAPPMPNT